MISRIARQAEEGLLSDTTESEWHFFPPAGQWGTAWLPGPNSEDPKLNLDKVELLYWIFALQEIIGVIGLLHQHITCCKKEEAT